eukprot:scaffold49013_cov53-Phaeocystis_antarctica.AAC.5
MEDGAEVLLGAGGSGALRLPRLKLREWVVPPLAAAGLCLAPGLWTAGTTHSLGPLDRRVRLPLKLQHAE